MAAMNFVICPWLAFGHMLPCLELAHRLAARGQHVTFVSTPRNISRLPLPVAPAPLVDLVALSLPPDAAGLFHDGAEATSDVPADKADLHRAASDGLAAPFSEFLDAACAGSRKPDWVMVDPLNHWAAVAAAEHGVPCAGIFICGATMFSPWRGSLSYNDDWLNAYTRQHQESGMSIVERIEATLRRCKLAGVRSCPEWEPDAVRVLKTHPNTGTPLVPMGLLPPSSISPSTAQHGRDDDSGAIVRWLDAQPAKSVVYVAMGTEVPLRQEQVHEMALGLELSGARFLWALRKPAAAQSDADVLPPGFEERTRGRGLVVLGWVPQVSILAHSAVAAFVTHCGWSSVIEGLSFGRPLVMLPITMSDQWPNARLMEGRGVGVQVPRDDKDGSFHRDGLAAAVRAVTEDKEGIFAANANKLQRIAEDIECHERSTDEFVQHLRSYMEK